MQTAPDTTKLAPATPDLGSTRRAFDGVADAYDDGNPHLARMRRVVWKILESELPPRGRLLDLGCGPGIDAVHMAQLGHTVAAVDWSPAMAAATRARADAAGAEIAARVEARAAGIHEGAALPDGPFDGMYSNFGPLNCVPDLAAVAAACAARLRPGGRLIVCVMGRHVPWEWLRDGLRGDPRGLLRARRAPEGTLVSLGHHAVWTRYYAPRELYRSFAASFALSHYRGLGLFLPPPHVGAGASRRNPALAAGALTLLRALEDRLAGLPLLRDAGDHFVMVMIRR